MASLTAFLSRVMYQAVNAFAKADRITQLYLFIIIFNNLFLMIWFESSMLRDGTQHELTICVRSNAR